MKTIVACILLMTVVGCCSMKSKASSSAAAAKETVLEKTKMLNEGYIKGTIVYSDKPDDCAYTIQLEGKDKVMYDPMNLEIDFQKHGEQVWFTFSPLRRMNRCIKANPIRLTDIKKGT